MWNDASRYTISLPAGAGLCRLLAGANSLRMRLVRRTDPPALSRRFMIHRLAPGPLLFGVPPGRVEASSHAQVRPTGGRCS